MKKCLGCGLPLQDQDPKAPGYVKDLSQDYCRRCFRLIHYGEKPLLKKIYTADDLLGSLKEYPNIGLIFIMDILNLDCAMNAQLLERLKDYPLIIIINKTDLLPANVNNQKVEEYCLKTIGKYVRPDQIISLLMTNAALYDLDDLLKEDLLKGGKDIYAVCGLTNVGKSTILNKLIAYDLTIAHYPGTTMAFNAFAYDRWTLIDTPGVIDPGNLINRLKPEDIKAFFPKKCFKPAVYQLYDDQSFLIEGIMRLDVICQDKGSLVFNFDPDIKIHRTKLSNADIYQAKHPELCDRGYLLEKYAFKGLDGHDLIIDGLGYITFHQIDQCEISLIEGTDVSIKERSL